MSSIPEGATHWAADSLCTSGIQYYRIRPGQQYQFFGPGGVWVNGGVSGDYPRVPVHPVSDELPLGVTVCEAKRPATGQWCKVKVLSDKEPGSPHRACRDENDRLWWASEFRPIRTPEQIAAEEREKAAAAMSNATQGARNWAEAFRMLHDAGYRKP